MSPTRHPPAGTRHYWLAIQKLTQKRGPSGFPVENWTDLDPLHVLARKDDMGGRERFVANQLSSPFDTVWQIPYLADMDPDLVNVPKMRRVVHQNRVYDIVSAQTIGYHRAIQLETLAGGTLG